jgi:hypothetical protein
MGTSPSALAQGAQAQTSAPVAEHPSPGTGAHCACERYRSVYLISRSASSGAPGVAVTDPPPTAVRSNTFR